MRAFVLSFAIVAALAACEPATPEAPPGSGDTAMCGGLQGLACGPGTFCSFAPGAQCGAADQTGVCMPRPEVCTEQYAPVCGCDDQTYSNACHAAMAGVSVLHGGECT